ncbi:MAG: TetR/AcrR family transcriptional regulator [Myxococcota bacterium]
MARRRRPAAETRREILDVATELLQRDGPAGLRLDDVAAAIGASRQAVLHHFGSRDGLLRHVAAEAWSALFAELSALSIEEPGDLRAVIERVDDAVRVRGHARIGGWLTLSRTGLPDDSFDAVLSKLPEQMGTKDDVSFRLLLVGAAMFGDAVFGERIRMALGLEDGETARADFRTWLAELLSVE